MCKCNSCHWNIDLDKNVIAIKTCSCNEEIVHQSPTQYTNQCIGYLEEENRKELI